MESIDDVWADQANKTSLPLERRKARARFAWIAGGSYLFDALVLALFASAGRVPFSAPVGYAVGGTAITLLFVSLHLSGFGEDRNDPALAIEQMLAGIGLQMAATYVAPSMAIYFMGLLFLIFAFGISRLNWVQALTIWLLSCTALGLVLNQNDFKALVPMGSTMQGVLAWIAFSSILLRGIGVSIYANLARHRTFAHNLRLAQEAASAKAMAPHDTLTGALNRHAILPMVEHQISLAGRSKEAFALSMLDLDHFKLVNDHFGHQIGDKVLSKVVRIAKDILRTSDQIGRYGGEEFLVLLPGSSGHEAIAVINRLRAAVESYPWSDIAPGLEIRISAGIAPFAPGDTVEKLVGKSDYGLYKAKNSGRNRVVYVGGE